MTIPKVKRVVMNMSEKKFVNASLWTRSLPYQVTTSWVAFSFLLGSVSSAINSGSNIQTAGIPQGTTSATRIGNKIRITSIKYRFLIMPTGGMDTTGGNICRVAIYDNKQTNGTLVSPLDAYQSNTTTSLRNPNGLQKVTIKRDVSMAMVPTSATSSGPIHVLAGALYPNRVIQYTGTAATIADLLGHDYGFMIVADVSPCCEVVGEWQVNFIDA